MALQRGDVVESDNYGSLEVQELVNIGAYADAYRSKDSSGTQHFLKHYKDICPKYHRWFRDYDEYQKEIIARLKRLERKKYIIPVLDTFVYKDHYYQVHEWSDAPELEELMESLNPNNKGDHTKAIDIADHLLDELEEIHKCGVLHTDLKPKNIAIEYDSNGEVHPRITDFDWSLISGKAYPWEGNLRGSPFYCSFEQMAGQNHTEESDIFTMGIILYELLSGYNPMHEIATPGDPDLQKLNRELVSKLSNLGDIPTPLDLNPSCSLSEAQSKQIRACLSSDKKMRPNIPALRKMLISKEVMLVLKSEGHELRFRRSDVENGTSYLGREKCRRFGNYKEISRLHAWLMPSGDYTKWFAVPPDRASTNMTTIERSGNETEFKTDTIELKEGNIIRIRGRKNPSYIIAEWAIELRPQ